MSYVLTETDEGLLIFTIQRSEKRNAINYEVMAGLEQALETARNSDHHAFVITGSGNQAFCAGGDLSDFHALKTEAEAYLMLSRMAKILFDLFMLPKPTIALMNGIALGGGCEIAAACDLRFAHEDVKAGFVQGKLNITTGWGGSTFALEKLPTPIGINMLWNASTYSAEELKQMGFVDYVYSCTHQEGLRVGLQHMLSIDPLVLAFYKKIVNSKRDRTKLWQQVDQEVRNCAILWEREEHHQKVDEFLKQRKKK